jgi:uncharacterized protein (TIGR02594 family)
MNYDIRWLQKALQRLDLYHGEIDGIAGPKTHEAIIAFKKMAGLRARAFVGPLTLRKLANATGLPLEESNGPVELPWINEINKVLGLHETRDNKVLTEWLRSDGHLLGDPARLAWCGDATETAVRRGLPNEKIPENPYWARNWGKFGIACGTVYGAIATFSRGSGGHVGFLVGMSQDRSLLRIRGGNQSNAINDTWISTGRNLALRWPSTFSTKHQTPAPRMASDGAIISRNEA